MLAVEPHPKQREQEQARQAAAHAEQERLQNEQEAAAAGVLRQHVATLPKYDYKVLTLSSKIWSGSGKFGSLEQELNKHAKEGWRVIEIAMSGKIEETFAADRNDIYIVFERPAAN